MAWWAVLFWIWVVVSLVLFPRRRIATRAAREVAEADEASRVDELIDVPEKAPEPAMAAAPAVVTPPPSPMPDPVVDRSPKREVPAAGIAEALVGIRMPCDLVPLVFDRLATDRITLSTVGFPAEAVGTALADEVERLGYVVRPLSDTEVIATRGVTELRLTITPPGIDGRHVHHPQARDDSVVVEIIQS
jgi:hypothetical protein